MKKIILLSVCIVFAMASKAQSNTDEITFMQSVYGMQKKQLIEEHMKISEAQKAAFWKLYDEYETARKDLAKKRIDLLEKYANNYDKMTNEFADKWASDVLSLTKQTDALVVTYYGKIKKVTNPVVALQFWQVEGYILSGIRLSLLESLPLPDLK